MVGKRSGLGRNLSALLSSAGTDTPLMANMPDRLTLPIHQLQPGKYQPRGPIDEGSLLELTESIKKQGLLQPLIVREIAPASYEIIAGERRWRACQMADMTDIPVILRQVDDETAMAMALVENLQREDLNVMEQARAMERLTTEFALTHQQVADLLSISRAAVSNALRLLNLSAEVRYMLEQGRIDMGHARCLLMLDETQQTQVARLVAAKELSVRDTEMLVTKIKNGVNKKVMSEPVPTLFNTQLQKLAQQLQTKISLKHGKAGKGELRIYYENPQSLEKMMDALLE